jgi:hypothetical protein
LVLIVGVVVLVGALIAAIAVFAGGGGSTDAAATSTTETPTTADPHPDWIAFVDPDGSFAAEFPNQPTFTQSLDDVGGGIFLPTKEWLSTDGTTRYAVSRLEMPAGALQLVDAQSLLLESAKTNSDPNATVLTAAPTSIDGDPAVDIALQLANGRYSLGHAIIHRDRIWVVWTESDKPLPEEQAFFLKNFVIVPQ